VEAVLDGDGNAAFEALEAGGGRVVKQPDTQTRQVVLARDFAALYREERSRTLVLDPTRQGRQELTDAIRAALFRNGTLGGEAIVATVPEPRELTRAEARVATSYQPGDIVAFRKSEKGRSRAGVGPRWKVADAERGTVRLVPEHGKAQYWQPARWVNVCPLPLAGQSSADSSPHPSAV
jgi:hypothetical protein